ncbi:hypothetical protein [Hyphomicrobium facile]|uniref:Acid shock protein n=1 Tax=Hyphomicrobium facile TaxID=51670 RepID=A0A1I7NFB9_9HYPH|nr:hypothetical protein [Hyphomicrobium facile]SFV33349.1 hypothetical protein SAMN04488557_1939 [Hyphomicrobium facile]
MKIAKLALLGAFVLGASISAEAATSAPKLHAPGVKTLAAHTVKDEKKKHAHAHRAHKHKHKHKVAEVHAKPKPHKAPAHQARAHKVKKVKH